MPSKGPDRKKLTAIEKALKSSASGLWIRELARKAKLDKSLVSRYLTLYLADKTEFFFIGSAKIVKLKK